MLKVKLAVAAVKFHVVGAALHLTAIPIFLAADTTSTTTPGQNVIPAQCQAADAIGPVIKNLGGQIVGLTGFAKFFILLAIAGLVLVAAHRKGSQHMMRIIILTFVAVIAFEVAGPILSNVVPSTCGS